MARVPCFFSFEGVQSVPEMGPWANCTQRLLNVESPLYPVDGIAEGIHHQP